MAACIQAGSRCASTPEFRAFKGRIERVRVKAEQAAKKYGSRIAYNWPAKLAYLLEDVRYRADPWSMIRVADISESTPTEGLRLVWNMNRLDDDAEKFVRYPFQTKIEGSPPLTPVEQRLAREALHALDVYSDEAFSRRNLSAVEDKAGAMWLSR